MARIDLTDVYDGHHRLHNADVISVRALSTPTTEDAPQDYIVHVRANLDEDGNYSTWYADGYQPADFRP